MNRTSLIVKIVARTRPAGRVRAATITYCHGDECRTPRSTTGCRITSGQMRAPDLLERFLTSGIDDPMDLSDGGSPFVVELQSGAMVDLVDKGIDLADAYDFCVNHSEFALGKRLDVTDRLADAVKHCVKAAQSLKRLKDYPALLNAQSLCDLIVELEETAKRLESVPHYPALLTKDTRVRERFAADWYFFAKQRVGKPLFREGAALYCATFGLPRTSGRSLKVMSARARKK